MTYFTSDQHFGHDKIIEYCHRPFANIERMEAAIIRNWNNKVSKHDTVYVLGDFSFEDEIKTKHILSRLHGYKRLILGNHDRKSMDWNMRVGFHRVYDKPILVDDWFLCSHEPPSFCLDKSTWVSLFGHVHNSSIYKTVDRNGVCVCVERWGYAPVSMDQIKQALKQQNGKSNHN